MSDTYKELMVKKQNSTIGAIVKIFLYALAAGCVILWILTYNFIILIVGVALGVGGYLMALNSDLEYEYLYLDKELSVDKIMAKTKRKKVGTYDIERMEILAPVKSHRLDSYNNRKMTVSDYSSGSKEETINRYALIYEGDKKIIVDLTPEFVKAIYNNAPRKVFSD